MKSIVFTVSRAENYNKQHIHLAFSRGLDYLGKAVSVSQAAAGVWETPTTSNPSNGVVREFLLPFEVTMLVFRASMRQ